MTRITAAIIALTLSGAVQASGFSPWPNPDTTASADERQDSVEVGPYYRDGMPQRGLGRTEAQADVVVRPWYADDRV
ncbi:MAG: hypothetical protein ACU85V_07125 [Gammaproteobacteria bacterium]